MKYKPDYTTKSIEELYESYNLINREKFPERFLEIKAEIEKRKEDDTNPIIKKQIRNLAKIKSTKADSDLILKNDAYSELINTDTDFLSILKSTSKMFIIVLPLLLGSSYKISIDYEIELYKIVIFVFAYIIAVLLSVLYRVKAYKNGFFKFENETFIHSYNGLASKYNIKNIEFLEIKVITPYNLEFIYVKFVNSSKLSFGEQMPNYLKIRDSFIEWVEANIENSDRIIK